jgi:hypothetical protein
VVLIDRAGYGASTSNVSAASSARHSLPLPTHDPRDRFPYDGFSDVYSGSPRLPRAEMEHALAEIRALRRIIRSEVYIILSSA